MTATRWTKKRIFSSSGAAAGDSPPKQFVGGPTSPPPISASPIAIAASDPSHYYAKPTIELSLHDGTFLIAYPTCAQLWEFSPHVSTGGAYCITGSTFGVNGKIISAHFINYKGRANHHREEIASSPAHTSKHNSPSLVLLQVVRRNEIQLEVHQINSKPSFVQTLVLPPASSGPGPYSVYTRHTDKCIAIITKAGAVTLFSVPDFNPLPLSGLETALNAEGLPLFDICGRWLVYSPAHIPSQTVYTPLKLPPPGLLLDRILENISTTTAASLKTLSDAGVAGLRHYLAKDSVPTSKPKEAKRTGNNVIYVGSNKFDVDASGRVGSAGHPGMAALPAALSSLFSTQAKSQPIQIIDLETQTTVSTFLSPQGLSYMSLSPHDAVLATVSAKGENVFTFDLSFTPRQVSLSGKYVRGKTPAKVSHIEWDCEGGLGIITSDKGSVHWFERQPWNTYESQVSALAVTGQAGVIPNSNKVWRLSGWQVSGMCMIPETIGSEAELKQSSSSTSPSSLSRDDGGATAPALHRDSSTSSLASEPQTKHASRQTKIAMLREGEIMVLDLATGTCSWKYDLPSAPIGETLLGQAFPITNKEDGPGTPLEITEEEEEPEPTYRDFNSLRSVEPLSFYEVETCLPYPFLHTDRHVLLATYDDDEQEAKLSSGVFGLSVQAKELDFGRANGLADFSGEISTPSEPESPAYEEYALPPDHRDAKGLKMSIPWEKAEELQQAMESLVINP